MNDSLEARLQATLNVIPANTWYAAPSGALTFVNTKGADFAGLPADHPLRLGIDTGAAWDSHIPFLHPDDHDETRRVWANCLKTGSAAEMTFRVRDSQGEYRWRISRVEPLRGSDGKLLYWIGINLDVEELKRAEEALRRNEHFLAEAQILSRVGSVGMDVSTKRIFWSEEAARIYGYAPGTEPTPDLILQRVHPEDAHLVRDAIHMAPYSARRVEIRLTVLTRESSGS
jgi:PAS domain S-box-containing protein